MLSAICFNLDQSKSLSSGNELSTEEESIIGQQNLQYRIYKLIPTLVCGYLIFSETSQLKKGITASKIV